MFVPKRRERETEMGDERWEAGNGRWEIRDERWEMRDRGLERGDAGRMGDSRINYLKKIKSRDRLSKD